ncbi:MAG: hypothetical protein IJA22_00810, partial [Clostridia bacterium]|nr:hypothetical protein [Clostridia bacterium]
KTGVYSNQFLTENYKGVKTVLHDGYAGSDKYTSVFCLGLCNPWGNVWTWIFGTSVISTGGETPSLEMYIKASTQDGTLQFDAYDYKSTNETVTSCGYSGNYVVTTPSTSEDNNYTTNQEYLTSRGYVQVGSGEAFDLPEKNGHYTHFGVAETTDETQILSLIGMPSASATASAGSGLTDYYYCNTSAGNRYGVLVGGDANDTANAGAFSFSVHNSLTYARLYIGFRPALILG